MIDSIETVMRLAGCPGVGPRIYGRLLEAFGSAEAVLEAGERELREVEDVGATLAGAIRSANGYDPRPELERAAEMGVQLVHRGEGNYPEPLRQTFDPPILLYIKGELRPSDALALAMVGTRRPSQYGRAQAERFSNLLARSGFTVVSGLARGIDSASHRGALQAGGRTVAVLGSGIGRIYPEENRDLAAEICRNGALVSEFPLETGPSRENFPRRNRIIAGLSLGTLVVEAPRRSGALITARNANELGREVYAVPGRIDQRNAEGCNYLIQAGQAKLVQSLEDILEELGPVADELRGPVAGSRAADPRKAAFPARGAASAKRADVQTALVEPGDAPEPAASVLPPAEEKILAALEEGEPVHIDAICAQTGLAVSKVSASLMMLELKRRVRQQPGRFFVRA